MSDGTLWDRAISLDCHRCGAAPGEECVVVGTYRRAPMHANRFRRAMALRQRERAAQ